MGLLAVYICFCAIGCYIGIKLKNDEKNISWSGNIQTVLLIVLLFTMGARIFANDKVVKSLGSIGISALVLTFSAMVGSLLFIYIFRKLMGYSRKGVKRND